MKIIAISDTHLGPEEPLSEPLVAALRGADLILHAGDIATVEAYRRICAHGRTVAVRGNMDLFPLDGLLPEREIVEAAGLRIGITHGGGSPFDIEERVLAAFRDERLDLIVFGHTHKPLSKRCGGLLLVNPGSAVPGDFTSLGSYLRIDAERAATPRMEFVQFSASRFAATR